MAQVPKTHLPVTGTERKPVPGAKRVGPADPEETLTVSIRVRRGQDAPPVPGLNDYAPNTPRRRFSHEEFAKQFGASQADLDRVASFGQSYGLEVVESSLSRRAIVLFGTVKQMNRAFAVDLGRYESSRGVYRGREGAVHVPREITDIVEGVFGLDNRRMAQRISNGGSHSLAPREVAHLYEFPLNINAAGQTIGILEFGGGYNDSDIQSYFNSKGLSVPPLVPVGVDGATNSPGSQDDGEVALDIEVAGAVAQGAAIAVYFAPFTECGWVDIVTTAIHGEKLPPGWSPPNVISISWAWAELEATGDLAWTSAAIKAVNETFQEAAAFGITVLAASGDNGSDCQIHDGKAHVYYPASDPWITCCGGTTLQIIDGVIFSESTWNDDGVTGGGISDIFPIPYWQLWANVPASINDGHIGRGIPDIAGYADGYDIYVDGDWQRAVNGTSETAPLYAGLMALINSAIGDSVGYINPILYNLSSDHVFRDISDGGSNSVSPAPGYTSVQGWDACTGWGSVNGSALLNAIETALFSMTLPTMI
jgi:kumamolisin